MCALPASAQQPPLPGTPPVTAPSVTVPPVTVPPVTVPTVTVPPMPVTPEVTTPPAQTPTVTTPSVSTSSGAANGAAGGSGSGDGQSSSSQGNGSGQASGAGQSGAGQPDTGRASATGPSGAGKSGSSSGEDPGNAPARRRDRDRDLRQTVLDHEACLGRMPRGERRVLTLRAGVGIAHPRSHAQVQRITGLRRTRIAALERSGLQRLRSLAQAGGCGQATSAARRDLAPVTGASGARGISGGASIPRIAVLGARESDGAGTPPSPPTGSPDPERPLLHAPDSAADLGPILLLVLLAGFVFAAVREARRSA
jgi:hypothetical protein